jgi:hypothetical protein
MPQVLLMSRFPGAMPQALLMSRFPGAMPQALLMSPRWGSKPKALPLVLLEIAPVVDKSILFLMSYVYLGTSLIN